MKNSSKAYTPGPNAAGQLEFGFCKAVTLPGAKNMLSGIAPWTRALTAANENNRLRLVGEADDILRNLGVIRPIRRRLNAIGLFDGIGAHELAIRLLGLPVDVLAHAEIGAVQSAVLAERFPGGRNLGDVTAADFVERAHDICPQGYDLAVATPPCIDFSVGGKRRGTDAKHGRLTLLTVDILNKLGIPTVLLENVPGLLSNEDGKDFGQVLGRLIGAGHDLVPKEGTWSTLGYAVGPLRHVAWRVLDARHFGMPQRRRRVFILAAPEKSVLNIFN